MNEIYELMVEDEFSSAHFLRGYHGKCENIHGHNWKVQVFVKSEKLNKIGLVEDFKKLKKDLSVSLDKLDHKFINDIQQFKKINPSSENIAKFIFTEISEKIETTTIRLSKVTVWESSNSNATYSK